MCIYQSRNPGLICKVLILVLCVPELSARTMMNETFTFSIRNIFFPANDEKSRDCIRCTKQKFSPKRGGFFLAFPPSHIFFAIYCIIRLKNMIFCCCYFFKYGFPCKSVKYLTTRGQTLGVKQWANKKEGETDKYCLESDNK